jgi:fucose permease
MVLPANHIWSWLQHFQLFLFLATKHPWLLQELGYKKTMAFSFLIFEVGFYLFIPSAKLESLQLFLLASFISGVGNAFLQASVDPYITLMGSMESAAKRMSYMVGIANKLA